MVSQFLLCFLWGGKKKSLIVIRIHLQKWFSILQSTCQNSLLSWACFLHSFTYSNIFSGTMLGVGKNGECSFAGLITTHHSYSSLIIVRSRTSVIERPTHLVHTNLSVRNLTFQLELSFKAPYFIPSEENRQQKQPIECVWREGVLGPTQIKFHLPQDGLPWPRLLLSLNFHLLHCKVEVLILAW